MRRMNQLVLAVNTLLSVAAAVITARSSGDLAWIGALFAIGPLLANTIMILFWPAARRSSAHLLIVLIPSQLGLVITASPFIGPGRQGAAYPSGRWSSQQRASPSSSAPNWCTLWMEQLKAIRDRAGQFARAGVNVKFISNQPVIKSQELAARFKPLANVEMPSYLDLRAAHTLAIVDTDGNPAWMIGGLPLDTVMATVIGLDETNRVLYAYQQDHCRSRPGPDSLLSFFEQLGRISARQGAKA